MAEVQNLQRQGAAYVLSTDQEWLGHHPDYKGLLTDYSVLEAPIWVGTKNYVGLFTTDKLFLLSASNTAIYAAMLIPIPVPHTISPSAPASPITLRPTSAP